MFFNMECHVWVVELPPKKDENHVWGMGRIMSNVLDEALLSLNSLCVELSALMAMVDH